MQKEILDMLIEQKEVSWKTIIQDLVKTEEMDPWDINITLLTQKYIKVIKKMQEHDLGVSGKILLAAAILLKMKSIHLIDNDISKLDQLINQEDEFDEEFFEDLDRDHSRREREKFKLIPKNPQPRSRKVSINDLINALQKAMVSKKRILEKYKPIKFDIPKGNFDIVEVIKDLYHKIVYYSKKEKKLTFSQLLPPRAGRREKTYTFIPLLHLENEQKIETSQREHFDEIYVKLMKGR